MVRRITDIDPVAPSQTTAEELLSDNDSEHENVIIVGQPSRLDEEISEMATDLQYAFAEYTFHAHCLPVAEKNCSVRLEKFIRRILSE